MAKENYPFDLVDMANKDIIEYGYRLRSLLMMMAAIRFKYSL